MHYRMSKKCARDSPKMTNRHDLWRELEGSLASLVDSVSTKVDMDNLKLLNEFIENREYGIALEWLHGAIVDRSKQLSPQQEKGNSTPRRINAPLPHRSTPSLTQSSFASSRAINL